MPVETNSVLISDDMLYGYSEKLGEKIQPLLENLGSWLAKYKVNNVLFSEFINTVCKAEDKNPLYFVSLIQKEQSAVQKAKQPAKGVMDKIVGFGCLEGGTKISKYAGFENQLRSAIKQFKRYETWTNVKHWRTHRITLYDNATMLKKYGCPPVITASSKAEAASFLYNPRIEGIANHAAIYRRYESIIDSL